MKMKKMLSLAAMFAVLSYASPASAELKISGDASTRLRGEFNNKETVGTPKTDRGGDDLKYQYKVRLKASADLGDGYFFKALVANEELVAGSSPGWATVAGNNGEKFQLEVSNFYFGREMDNCHYKVGRIPLNSLNNPVFDITLYPVPGVINSLGTKVYAVDVPIYQYNYDRVFGINYGSKVGNGDLNATLVVLDNNSIKENDSATTGNGLFNDGYLLHLTYKTNIGNVTVEPQALITLTDAQGATYQKVSPNTFGANATIPAGKSKIGLSGFYTVCKDSNGTTATAYDPTKTTQDNSTILSSTKVNVDYNGYLVRVKGESGPVTAWVDYNHTTDKSSGGSLTEQKYNNLFVWAQYKVNVHESALGTVSLTPTVRYRASAQDGTAGTTSRNNQLRTELYATVTF
jgi:hypothetical protein